MPLLTLQEQRDRARSSFIKKRIAASQWLRSVQGAVNTIQGYKAAHMIRKGQIRWLHKGDIAVRSRFVNPAFGLAANLTTSTTRAQPVSFATLPIR